MRKIIKYGIFLVGALSLLTLYALNNSSEPIGSNICIDFILYTHEELRDNSYTIVTGTVKEILQPRWNTADGKQPHKLFYNFEYPDDIIYTDIVISVDEYLKNPLSSRELVVRVTGGTIGDFSMTTDADPSFNAGEKVLLYLRKDANPNTKDIGPEHFIVTDFYRGKYTLTDDGKAITPDENTTIEELLSTITDSNSTAGKSKHPEAGNTDELANNDQPLYAEVSSSLVGLNHTELSEYSETIVIGVVKEILPSKYGNRFSKDTDFGPDHVIYTDIIISVDEYLKNPLSSKELIVRVTGGTVGNDSLTMEDEPSFKTGEKVFLYLTTDTSYATRAIGPEHFTVTGALQGKFTLNDDGKATRPGETVSQEELLSTINQANKKSAPFMNSFWMLAAMIGAVQIIRHR